MTNVTTERKTTNTTTTETTKTWRIQPMKTLSNKQRKLAKKRFPKQKRNEVPLTPAFIASLPVSHTQ